jgi:sortase (surface protein transpeptidase)
MKTSQKKKLNKILNVYIGIGVGLWVISALLIFTPIVPQIWYSLVPDATANESSSLSLEIHDDNDTDKLASIRQSYLDEIAEEALQRQIAEAAYIASLIPPLNTSLSKTNMIRINKIGVDTKLQEGSNSEAELKKGPWIVYDFGKPDDQFAPIIIASHRWGAIGWSANDRKTKSFLKLPDLKNGDIVQIIWDQRMYEYKIYAGEENTRITDYDADLILYTCKLYWESPIRIFKYAERIN